jgi:hypothetical protein
MTPEEVLYTFIELYNNKKFDYALKYTYISIFPGKEYLENLYKDVGKFKSFTIIHSVIDDTVCIIHYRTTTHKGVDEGYILLLCENGSWLIVTKDKDKKWLFDFGKNCAIPYKESRKALIDHVKSTQNPIDNQWLPKFFYEIAQSHSIILFGTGVHHSQEPHHIFLQFIRYLNSMGYRDLLMEFPCSFTWFYHRYLETGDLHYYRTVGDEGHFFRDLYQFNASLPSSQKLRVWGMDVDHSLYATIYQIEEYLEDISDMKLKEKILSILSPFWAQNIDITISMMEFLGKTFWDNREIFISETNERDFYRICNTIENSRKSSKVLAYGEKSEKFREEFIKKRFADIHRKLQKTQRGKLIVLFGNGHTAKYSFTWQSSFEKLGEYLYRVYGKKVYSIDILPYKGVYYPSLYRNSIEKITIPKGSIEYIIKNTVNSFPVFIDITTLGDYTFYDRTGYFVSPLTHDAIILCTSSLPSRLNKRIDTS